MRFPPRLAAGLSPLLLLSVAGCAAGDAYPSLAPRPIERRLAAGEGEGGAGAAAPAAADAALVVRIAAIDDTARAADRAFAAAADAAAQAIGLPAAGNAGSDAWAAAQTLYSAAVSARGALQDAADAIDTLARGHENGAAADLAVLDAARDAVAQRIAAADARLATLSGRLAE